MTPDMIYDSPPDALALEREAVTLPRTPARHFYDLNKMPPVTVTLWGILFIARLFCGGVHVLPPGQARTVV